MIVMQIYYNTTNILFELTEYQDIEVFLENC